MVADAADGADGMFDKRAHVDHSRSCSALARECNLDAQGPQERLRPPKPAGERSRCFWPTGACLPNLVTGRGVRELAEKAGITANTVTCIENGADAKQSTIDK